MNILIVGAGKVGVCLAKDMSDRGHKVKIIEKNEEVCNKFEKISNVEIVCGDGCDFAVVEVIVPAAAKTIGKAISEIQFPQNTRVTAIISGMKVTIPSGNTVIKEGDKLIVFSEDAKREDLLKALGI